MKAAIAGACVSVALLGFEAALGKELSWGVRLMIAVPLWVLAGLLVGGGG